jgi:hypothetical protein
MIRRISSRWMLMAVAVLTIVPLVDAQAQIAGDWQGVATVEGTDYHIIVHIMTAKDGTLAATLDSPETGVATSGVMYKDSKFSMNVDAYHGVFTGTLNGDGTKITGVFEGDHETPLEFTRVAATAAPTGATAMPAGEAAPAGGSIAGDWHGSLEAGGKTLRLVLHIPATTGGTQTGTLDSVDQGLSGIPVTAIVVKDSKLTFTVDSLPVHASYEGTVKPAGSEIDGTWTQGGPMTLNFAPGVGADAASKPATPSDIDGTWAGMLDVNGKTLHVLLKVTNTADGLTAQLQSPDQNPMWVKAYALTRENGTLSASFAIFGVELSGKIAADLGSIDGTLSQGGGNLPLVLKRQQ